MNIRQYRQEDGRKWSQWENFTPTTHVSCCDCGLVHTYQFRLRPGKDGQFLYMRVKRNETKTKKLRANKHKKFPCRLTKPVRRVRRKS